jgi:glucosamine kinase
MAGSMVLRDPAVREGFDAVWSSCGLPGVPSIVSDLEVAYASAAEQGSGLVLIAGTGVSAARIVDWKIQERRGGYGWLLGDEGAGVWLGRAAVRATLDALYAAQQSALAERVLAYFELPTDRTSAPVLIQTINRAGALALAELAPIVTLAHQDGAPDAIAIVDEAARLLVGTLSGLLSSVREGPIVLAGSILDEALPTGQAVRELLRAQGGSRLRFAASGTQGALVLAARLTKADRPR